MKLSKRNLVLKIILFTTLMFLLVFLFRSANPIKSNITNGLFDLREESFPLEKAISLDGEWEFYPRQLAEYIIFPKDINETEYLNVPKIWNNFEVNGEKIGGKTFGTYRLKLLLPKEKVYYLKIVNVATAYNLYVDGKKISSNGIVGENPEMHTPEFKSKVVSFESQNEITDIRMEISNFSHAKGGFWEPIIFGDLPSIKAIDKNKAYGDILITGFLLTTAFIYLNISAYIKQEKTFLYLASFLVLISIRLLFTGDKLITSFFPSFSWEFMMKLEYLSYYLAVPAFVVFLFTYFKEKYNSYIQLSLYFYFLNGLIVLLTPVLFFSKILTIVNVFTFIFGFYILWRIYIIFRSGKNGGLELFLGTLILLLSVIIEIIFIQRGNQIINTAIAGELIFVIILIFEVNKNFSMNVSTERDSILRLQDISNKDGLTGLFNHRFICQKLTDIYNENSEIPYSVAMFDLDNFKSINDTYGHKIGDLILQETARIMTENTRGSDTVGRYGGEEFLIIFYNTKIEDAYLVCDRIREKIEKEIVENTGIKITISGGLTGFSKEVEDIIKIADELMYKAKKLGKNRIEKFED